MVFMPQRDWGIRVLKHCKKIKIQLKQVFCIAHLLCTLTTNDVLWTEQNKTKANTNNKIILNISVFKQIMVTHVYGDGTQHIYIYTVNRSHLHHPPPLPSTHILTDEEKTKKNSDWTKPYHFLKAFTKKFNKRCYCDLTTNDKHSKKY